MRIFPKDTLVVATHNADSTKEEARNLLVFIKHHGFKKVIIVTSNYHTWRTKRVYEKEWRGSDISVYTSPAHSSQFHPDEWWKHRVDRRTFIMTFLPGSGNIYNFSTALHEMIGVAWYRIKG